MLIYCTIHETVLSWIKYFLRFPDARYYQFRNNSTLQINGKEISYGDKINPVTSGKITLVSEVHYSIKCDTTLIKNNVDVIEKCAESKCNFEVSTTDGETLTINVLIIGFDPEYGFGYNISIVGKWIIFVGRMAITISLWLVHITYLLLGI